MAPAIAVILTASFFIIALASVSLGTVGLLLAVDWAIQAGDRIAIAGFGGILLLVAGVVMLDGLIRQR